jgi:hypothetical protein
MNTIMYGVALARTDGALPRVAKLVGDCCSRQYLFGDPACARDYADALMATYEGVDFAVVRLSVSVRGIEASTPTASGPPGPNSEEHQAHDTTQSNQGGSP